MNLLLNTDGSPFLHNGKHINLIDVEEDNTDTEIKDKIVNITLDEVYAQNNDYQIKNNTAISELNLDVRGQNWAFVDDKTSELIIKSSDVDVNTVLYLDVKEEDFGDFNAVRDYNSSLLQDMKIIEIKEGVTQISSDSFYTKYSLETIILPESLKVIKSNAFCDCGLKNIYIPRNVNSIHNTSFTRNQQTLESIEVDANNERYSSYNNSNCIVDKNHNLTISINSKDVNINTALILGCKNTVIPSGVQYIAPRAFYLCPGLESINIPKTVKYIDFRAFSGCYNLKTINYEGTKAEWKNIYVKSGIFSLSSWVTTNKSYSVFSLCSDELKVKCSDGIISVD